jgi:phosphohistidine phosphatase
MPLILDLIRHGEAEQTGQSGDRSRHLTQEGEQAVGALGQRLAGAGSVPGRVFSSPLERALETARIVAHTAAPGVEIEALEELVPDADPALVLEALESRGVTGGHAVLVGHMPQIGNLHMMLTGDESPFPVATLRRVLFTERAQAGRGRAVLMLRP